MTTPGKGTARTASETWKALEEQASRDDLEEIRALSPRAVDAQLAAAKIDPDRVHQAGRAMQAAAARAASPAASPAPAVAQEPLSRRDRATLGPPLRSRTYLLLAAVLVVIAVAAAVAVYWPRPGPTPPIPPAPPEPAPTATPDEIARLRQEAFDACDRSSWQACLDRLDRAKALDPAGDTAPRVRDARTRARLALDVRIDAGSLKPVQP